MSSIILISLSFGNHNSTKWALPNTFQIRFVIEGLYYPGVGVRGGGSYKRTVPPTQVVLRGVHLPRASNPHPPIFPSCPG